MSPSSGCGARHVSLSDGDRVGDGAKNISQVVRNEGRDGAVTADAAVEVGVVFVNAMVNRSFIIGTTPMPRPWTELFYAAMLIDSEIG